MFKFKILGFFSSALERQVAEGMRIERTVAKRILNSNAAHNRSKLPRIVAMDRHKEVTLVDSMEQMEDEISHEEEDSDIILNGKNWDSQ